MRVARPALPGGFVERPAFGGVLAARADLDSLLPLIGGSLEAAFLAAGGTVVRAGRGRIVRAGMAGGRGALLRHLHHGGWMAPITRDVFWTPPWRSPRPLAELATSERARALGIDTPPVLAAFVRWMAPGGRLVGLYRGDVVVEEVPGAVDLATFLALGVLAPAAGSLRPEVGRWATGTALWSGLGLTGGALRGDPSERAAALESVGRTLGRAIAAGLHHPDLNARNVLVALAGGCIHTYIIDLDGASLDDPGGRDGHPARLAASARVHAARLARSLTKIGRREGLTLLSDAEARTLALELASACRLGDGEDLAQILSRRG